MQIMQRSLSAPDCYRHRSILCIQPMGLQTLLLRESQFQCYQLLLVQETPGRFEDSGWTGSSSIFCCKGAITARCGDECRNIKYGFYVFFRVLCCQVVLPGLQPHQL